MDEKIIIINFSELQTHDNPFSVEDNFIFRAPGNQPWERWNSLKTVIKKYKPIYFEEKKSSNEFQFEHTCYICLRAIPNEKQYYEFYYEFNKTGKNALYGQQLCLECCIKIFNKFKNTSSRLGFRRNLSRKTSKSKTSKRKTSKRKTSKRKTSKRQTSKRKTSKRKK